MTDDELFGVAARPQHRDAHLRRGIENGLTIDEISAHITHVAFYGGFWGSDLGVHHRRRHAPVSQLRNVILDG